MKTLIQKVNRLTAHSRPYAPGGLKDASPREISTAPQDGGSQNFSYPKGSKYELVETVENGWMDGRGDKHIVRILSNWSETYIYRGSLSNAFEVKG